MYFDISTSWLLLATLIALSVYWLRTKTRRTYSVYNIPPFPVRPWPFVGHFLLLFGNLRDSMKIWRKKAGNIYSLDLAGTLNILVNDFNDIKEVWMNHGDKVLNAPPSFADEILDEYDTGIFSARDDNWKEQRTTSVSILRSFGMGKNRMAEQIHVEVKVLCDKLSSLQGRPTDVAALLKTCVLNILSSVIVGKRFDHDDPDFLHFSDQLCIVVKYFNTMIFLTSLKQVFKLPGDLLHAKKWAKATSEITEMYSKPFIRQFKQEVKEDEVPHNFITAYLQEIKKMKDGGEPSHLSEKNLITLIRSMFIAGADTTANTILWGLIYTLYYPTVQEQIFREIEVNVGTERLPDLADRPKLTYLSAVVMETQRMCSIAPVGFRREVSETFELRGFTIPQGSVVWPVLDSVHFDEAIWGDPEIFRPERFLDEKGALISRKELLPFGIGRRVCLGEPLAKMELFLFISALCQRFRFEPMDKSGQLPSLKGCFGTTVVPEPFQMRFVER